MIASLAVRSPFQIRSIFSLPLEDRLQRIGRTAQRGFASLAQTIAHPHTQITALAGLALCASPSSLLTGMVAYACLLHAQIPLTSLHELADRCLAADASSVRMMLGVLMAGWWHLKPLLQAPALLAFLGPLGNALLSLIPMLIGCMLSRLAMEARPSP